MSVCVFVCVCVCACMCDVCMCVCACARTRAPWLEARGRLLRDAVVHGHEVDAERELRCDVRERVSRRLGCERGGAREARVHLDDAVSLRLGVQRVLYVALADDAQVTDDLRRGTAPCVSARE